jgi:hypothetical protein
MAVFYKFHQKLSDQNKAAEQPTAICITRFSGLSQAESEPGFTFSYLGRSNEVNKGIKEYLLFMSTMSPLPQAWEKIEQERQRTCATILEPSLDGPILTKLDDTALTSIICPTSQFGMLSPRENGTKTHVRYFPYNPAGQPIQTPLSDDFILAEPTSVIIEKMSKVGHRFIALDRPPMA